MIIKCAYCKRLINTNDKDEKHCLTCKEFLQKKLQMGSKFMISNFKGPNYFLSNFYSSPIKYDGLMYKNVEAAFQSAKTTNIEIRKRFQKLSPNVAKKMGRSLILRSDWDKIKTGVMYKCIKDKFTRDKKLGIMLLKTGNRILVEGNYWKDDFWGVCTKNGKNVLGRILMIVRDELNENSKLLNRGEKYENNNK